MDTPGVSTKAYESKIERSIIKSYMNTAQKVEHGKSIHTLSVIGSM